MNRFLFTLAKTWIGGSFLHWIIAYLTFAIPGEILIEVNELIAFYHPLPSYPLHILINPKAKSRSLMDLPSDGSGFESGSFKAVKELVQRFG